jgi:hypothetical protein|tara:strand:+ start:2453 stop:2956 length:504 start_codon:yes stop_codon:yes gene_type:complete
VPINKDQLRTLIVQPVLAVLDLPAPDVAENLLMGTAAHESHLGDYIQQVGGGPALGIYQMEPATLNDCYVNYLDYSTRAALKAKVDGFLAAQPVGSDGKPDKSAQLATNLAYATAMCRIRYYRAPGALPSDPNDLNGLAAYWKQYYNTPLGAGTVDQFIADYNRFLG